jgi:hypothetical protein
MPLAKEAGLSQQTASTQISHASRHICYRFDLDAHTTDELAALILRMAHQRSSAQARLYQVALTKRHELNDVIPAKAGIQRLLVVHNESHWVPAFAGTTLVVIFLD